MKLSLLKYTNQIKVLGSKINCSDYEHILKEILWQIKRKKSHFVCVAAVHLIMEAKKDRLLQAQINRSLVTVSDGVPLVWIAKLRGQKQTKRVYGPELMLKLCQIASKKGYKIFLLGGANGQCKILKKKLLDKLPNLQIVDCVDTPHRPIPEQENQKIIKKINTSKATIVFVGLGCPIQEKWMVENYKKLDTAICIGVGAAFDFISGKIRQAPIWMQNSGLEWFFRLLQEPKRLWKRYLILNTHFIFSLITEKNKQND